MVNPQLTKLWGFWFILLVILLIGVNYGVRSLDEHSPSEAPLERVPQSQDRVWLLPLLWELHSEARATPTPQALQQVPLQEAEVQVRIVYVFVNESPPGYDLWPNPTPGPQPTPSLENRPILSSSPSHLASHLDDYLPPDLVPHPDAEILEVLVTFYACPPFCGLMRNEEPVHEGAAACGYSLDLGDRFSIVGDYTRRVYTCEDTGAGPLNWVDIFFFIEEEGWEWQQQVGQQGVIVLQ